MRSKRLTQSPDFSKCESIGDLQPDYSQQSKIIWSCPAVVLEPNKQYYYVAAFTDGFSDCYGEIKSFTTKGNAEAYVVYKDSVLTFYYDDCYDSRITGEIKYKYDDYLKAYYDDFRASISEVIFDDSFSEYRPTSTKQMFDVCDNLKKIKNIKNLNTSEVTDMAWMFNWCNSLKELDLSHFNTENVTDMHRMFYCCYSLEKINLSSFKTSKVTDMAGMFSQCRSLKELDVSSFDTSNLIDMSGHREYRDAFGNYDGMFAGCSSLSSIDISNFDTSKVEDMFQLFQGCTKLKEINMSGFVFKNTSYSYNSIFSKCDSLTSINFSNGKIVGNAYFLFAKEALKEINLSNVDTSEATDLSFMFCDCKSLKKLDLSSFNTANVSTMIGMFEGCDSLVDLNVSNFTLNDNIIDIDAYGKLYTRFWKGGLVLEALDLSNVKIIGEAGYGLVPSAKTVKLDNIDTSEATNMSYMFASCSSLTNLNLSSFNTSNVTNMSHMFDGCSSLTNLNLSSFNTSKVTNMSHMFSSCSSLTNLDLSNFNTANVTQMTEMISGCTLLENLNINNFIISQDPIGIGNSSLKSISVCNGKVIGKGAENLFGSLYSLETVDLAGFDTSEATSLYAMFAWCSSLKTIDLTSFNVHKVNNYNRVFSGCRSLVTIYANNWLNPDEIYIYDNLEGQNIFEGCDKLVGGKGTKLGVNYIYGDDGSLLYYYYCSDSLFSLHIDGGWETPGLFTEK